MDALQGVEPFLDGADLDLQRICENGRVEFMALDAGGEQELTLVTRQLIDLSLNQRAHRLRQVALDVHYGVGQRPAITLLDDGAAVAQVTKNVAHEKGVTVGLRMNEVREVGRELVVRELQVDIRSHVVFTERCEGDVTANASSLQVAFELDERMVRQQQIGPAAGQHEQHRQDIESGAEKCEEIHGRRVGPVDVFEGED